MTPLNCPKQAQNKPKYQNPFHKNSTLCDLHSMTLIVAAALAKLLNTLFFHEKRSH